jgi:hypothetical protein
VAGQCPGWMLAADRGLEGIGPGRGRAGAGRVGGCAVEPQGRARAAGVPLRPRRAAWVQGVDATPPAADGVNSSWSRASAGVFRPRVLRGLLLRAAAMCTCCGTRPVPQQKQSRCNCFPKVLIDRSPSTRLLAAAPSSGRTTGGGVGSAHPPAFATQEAEGFCHSQGRHLRCGCGPQSDQRMLTARGPTLGLTARGVQQRRAHYLALYGRERPARTQGCIAVGP